ncbi:MAG: hypothetical protein HY912_07445 [Desulfomonile tiedjei]|uniref:Uncharacterized protein n=1 Tax=Desulfomonile tiedjei TaxID=2358 RepID=A0A9D6YZW9_9BACT|nr:hypothetical protein [Desulfomonile tiedjei]
MSVSRARIRGMVFGVKRSVIILGEPINGVFGFRVPLHVIHDTMSKLKRFFVDSFSADYHNLEAQRMGELETVLKAVERARKRKKALKNLMEILFEEYKLVKQEIKLHEECIEKLMSAKEYAAYVDTVELDPSLKFPIPPDQKSSEKK